MVEMAEMADPKSGLPTILKSETQGTISLGASIGRSCTPTAITTMITVAGMSLGFLTVGEGKP